MSGVSNGGTERFIDLPDIRFEGVLQNGSVYYRAADVEKWLRQSVKVARDNDLPPEVAIYVAGMLDAIKRARERSGF